MTIYHASVTCVRSAESGHGNKLFKKAERFANCKGVHTAYFCSNLAPGCPCWPREKEILSVKVTQKRSPKIANLLNTEHYLLVSLTSVYTGNNQNLCGL